MVAKVRWAPYLAASRRVMTPFSPMASAIVGPVEQSRRQSANEIRMTQSKVVGCKGVVGNGVRERERATESGLENQCSQLSAMRPALNSGNRRVLPGVRRTCSLYGNLRMLDMSPTEDAPSLCCTMVGHEQQVLQLLQTYLISGRKAGPMTSSEC